MKNVTVTLDEKTAAWAQVHAAKRNLSLSHFIGEVLHEKMGESRDYEEAMQRWMSRKPSYASDGQPYPKREELYDRKVFRR